MKAKFLHLGCLFVGTCCLAASMSAATPKIGVLLKSKTPFWAAMEKGAMRAGETLGAEVVVKSPINEADIAVQIQLLNALAGQGMDVIVLAANSRDSLVEPVAALRAKGTKVILIDSMIGGQDVPTFVGTDQGAAGQAAGEFIANLVGGADEVSLLRNSQTGGATMTRETRAIDALRKAKPDLVIHSNIFIGTDTGAEAQRSAYLLQQFPKTKVVLTSSTPGTMAMLRTLKEKDLAGTIKLVGFGFNLNAEVAAAIDAGELHCWVAQLPDEMGFQGVKAALALAKGESLPAVINTEFIVITKENLHTPSVQALLPQP